MGGFHEHGIQSIYIFGLCDCDSAFIDEYNFPTD